VRRASIAEEINIILKRNKLLKKECHLSLLRIILISSAMDALLTVEQGSVLDV
jgi:hypothetical protein